jgi:hypothetical protein
VNPRFSDEQLDAAISYVVVHGAMDRAKTIHYSYVFVAAGLEPPQDLHRGGEGDLVTRFMEALHFRCIDRGLPPLDSLVVNVAGPREDKPGSGYFTVNGVGDPFSGTGREEDAIQGLGLWERQMSEVKAWGVLRRRAGDWSSEGQGDS